MEKTFISRLAIIPAKGHSERCPGKNLRTLGGRPLFLHAVSYAEQEGFTPVVSTDSESVITLCKQENILYIREVVDDTKMENCIFQVLEHFSCAVFALLQPSSLFRQPGLLRSMAKDVSSGDIESGYTFQKIKVIGHLDGHFQQSVKMQNAKRFLYFFDGNISIITEKHFREIHSFFDDSSRPYPNHFPCCLQIDTEDEWDVLSKLSEDPEHQHLLGNPTRKKRICIISNKVDFKRDYSLFVDSCDKVMRVSKMDNLDSGLSGTRTDIVLVSCFFGYLDFSPEARHMETLRQIPEIYFNNEEKQCVEEFTKRESLPDWKFMPEVVHQSTTNFTTLSKALCLADYLFPDAQLYFLGDQDMGLRAAGDPKHHAPTENAYMQALIESGRLIHICEDELSEYRYSTKIKPGTAPIQRHEPDNKERLTLTLHYGDEERTFHVNDKRGYCWYGDHADILEYTDEKLLIQWDLHGIEEFKKIRDGHYQSLYYHFHSTINEVSKYSKELVIFPHIHPLDSLPNWNRPMLHMDYSLWDFSQLKERMLNDLKQSILTMPMLESILLLGTEKDSTMALMLAIELQREFPHLHIGVWGCPWSAPAENPLPIKRGFFRPRTLPQKEETQPSPLRAYEDPLPIMQKEDVSSLHLFSFYSSTKKWATTKESALRLSTYLEKNYIYQDLEGNKHSKKYGKIMHLMGSKPEFVHLWVDDMFMLLK